MRMISALLTAISLSACNFSLLNQAKLDANKIIFNASATLGEATIASNYIGSQVQGDVEIEILRIVCESVESHSERSGISISQYAVVFEDAVTLCLLVVRAINHSNSNREIFPDYQYLEVEDERLPYISFRNRFGEEEEPILFVPAAGFDALSGVIPGRAEYISSYWLSLSENFPTGDINQISYRIGAPLDSSGALVGEAYYFEIDTSNWRYSPLPEELEPLFTEWNSIP